MPILDFQRPDEVVMINEEINQGSFEFRPLEPGYGLTVGNALRRVLLSSLEGYSITSIRIIGADHEFTTIQGVVQDITEIILNHCILIMYILFLTVLSIISDILPCAVVL